MGKEREREMERERERERAGKREKGATESRVQPGYSNPG